MDSTSVSLLRRLREPQSDVAWQRFVELYAPLIFYWGRGKGLNATDAADLVQDVLTTLVVKLPEFNLDPGGRFRGWLRTLVVNRATDLRRRNSVRPMTGVDEVLDRLTVLDAGDLFDSAEYVNVLVRRTLELLRGEILEQNWRAAWMQLIEGRSAAEVARELGVSLNAAYLAKSRLLSRLRVELAGLLD